VAPGRTSARDSKAIAGVYRADPGDPAVLVGAVLAMALIGISGSAIPALRALAVDPTRLMRDE
jgi:hypothetical protein